MKKLTRIYQNIVSVHTLSFLTIIIFIISMLAAVHSYIITHDSEDDIQFLYYSTSKSVDTKHHLQMVDTVSQFLKSIPDAHFYSFRYDERQRVTGNYPLMTQSMAWVRSEYLDDFTRPNDAYTQAIANIYNVTLHLNIAVILFIFGSVILTTGRNYWPGIAIGLVAILIVDWYVPWKVPVWILHVRPQDFTEVIQRSWQAISLIFTVGGMESFFPRGHFIILTIPIFLLRWSGRYRTSYTLAAIACIVHLTMGALLLMCLLATDLLMRRKELLTPIVIGGIALSMAWLGSLGLLTNTDTLTSLPIILGIAAILAVGLYLTAKNFDLLIPTFISQKILTPINNTGPIASDLIVLYALWGMLVPFSLVMYFITGEPRNAWTWGELPGRYLMIVRGPLIIGLSIWLFSYLQRKNTQLGNGLVLVTLVLAIGLFVHALNKPMVFETNPAQLAAGLQKREITSIQAANGERFEYVEADIYFSIARAVDLNLSLPMGLLNFTPDACYRRYQACEP